MVSLLTVLTTEPVDYDTSFVEGWMVGIPLLLVVVILLGALFWPVQRDETPWDYLLDEDADDD